MKKLIKIFPIIVFTCILLIILSIHFQGRSYEKEIMAEESIANEAFLNKIAGDYTLDIKVHPENKSKAAFIEKYIATPSELTYDSSSDKPIILTIGETTFRYKVSIIDTNTVAGYIPDPYERRIVIGWDEDLNTIIGSIMIPINNEEEIILAFDGKRLMK